MADVLVQIIIASRTEHTHAMRRKRRGVEKEERACVLARTRGGRWRGGGGEDEEEMRSERNSERVSAFQDFLFFPLFFRQAR